MDWDDKIYWFLKHAHWAEYGHILWGVFVIFPKETGEFIAKLREFILFWKREGKMEKLKALFALIPEFEGIVADAEALETEAVTDPKALKLVNDLKGLIASLKAVAS